MEEQPVLIDTDARGVLRVTLNRPAVNNAYDSAMIDALIAASASARANSDIRVVVLTGRGRHFQAGADLGWLDAVRPQGAAANLDASERTAKAVWDLNTLPVPTLALIQGGCFGGGTGIAAACDVVVASEDAIFSISETRWGLMAGIILPQLCQAIGLRQVRRYALTGERFGAAEARRLGLVHEVCPTGGLDEAGHKVIEAVLMNAPQATTATKLRSLASARAFIDDGELRDLIDEHARARQQPEAAEGLASFREKRKPKWYPG